LSSGGKETGIKPFDVAIVTSCCILVSEEDFSVAVCTTGAIAYYFEITYSVRITDGLYLGWVEEDVALAVGISVKFIRCGKCEL
jgi:hypothetical protein